ncbi:unnamed protein product [Amaranthus hypochondriacus]
MEEEKGGREMAVVGKYDVRIARNLIGKMVGDWGLTWKPRWLTGRSMKLLKEAGFLVRNYIPAYFSSLTYNMIKNQARRIQLRFIFESIDDVTDEVRVLEEGWVTGSNKISHVQLVHVPGHSSLRPKLDEAVDVISIIDFLEFLPYFHSAAEYLSDICTKASVVKKRIPFLIGKKESKKLLLIPRISIATNWRTKQKLDLMLTLRLVLHFYPP